MGARGACSGVEDIRAGAIEKRRRTRGNGTETSLMESESGSLVRIRKRSARPLAMASGMLRPATTRGPESSLRPSSLRNPADADAKAGLVSNSLSPLAQAVIAELVKKGGSADAASLGSAIPKALRGSAPFTQELARIPGVSLSKPAFGLTLVTLVGGAAPAEPAVRGPESLSRPAPLRYTVSVAAEAQADQVAALSPLAAAVIAELVKKGGSVDAASLGSAIPKALRGSAPFTHELAKIPGVSLSKPAFGVTVVTLVGGAAAAEPVTRSPESSSRPASPRVPADAQARADQVASPASSPLAAAVIAELVKKGGSADAASLGSAIPKALRGSAPFTHELAKIPGVTLSKPAFGVTVVTLVCGAAAAEPVTLSPESSSRPASLRHTDSVAADAKDDQVASPTSSPLTAAVIAELVKKGGSADAASLGSAIPKSLRGSAPFTHELAKIPGVSLSKPAFGVTVATLVGGVAAAEPVTRSPGSSVRPASLRHIDSVAADAKDDQAAALSPLARAVIAELVKKGGSADAASLGAAIPKALRGSAPFTQELAKIPGVTLSKPAFGLTLVTLVGGAAAGPTLSCSPVAGMGTVPACGPSTSQRGLPLTTADALTEFDVAVVSELKRRGGSATAAALGAAIPQALRGPMPLMEQLGGVRGTTLKMTAQGLAVSLVDDIALVPPTSTAATTSAAAPMQPRGAVALSTVALSWYPTQVDTASSPLLTSIAPPALSILPAPAQSARCTADVANARELDPSSEAASASSAAMASSASSVAGLSPLGPSPDLDSFVKATLARSGSSMLASRLIAAIPFALRPRLNATAVIARIPGVVVVQAHDPNVAIVSLVSGEGKSAPVLGHATAASSTASAAVNRSAVAHAPAMLPGLTVSDPSALEFSTCGGYVFKSSPATHDECLSRMLFGAPAGSASSILKLRPRQSHLFLYSTASRNVIGVFTPTTAPGLMLEPLAFSQGGGPSPYPAQVCLSPTCNPKRIPPPWRHDFSVKHSPNALSSQVRVAWYHKFAIPLPRRIFEDAISYHGAQLPSVLTAAQVGAVVAAFEKINGPANSSMLEDAGRSVQPLPAAAMTGSAAMRSRVDWQDATCSPRYQERDVDSLPSGWQHHASPSTLARAPDGPHMHLRASDTAVSASRAFAADDDFDEASLPAKARPETQRSEALAASIQQRKEEYAREIRQRAEAAQAERQRKEAEAREAKKRAEAAAAVVAAEAERQRQEAEAREAKKRAEAAAAAEVERQRQESEAREAKKRAEAAAAVVAAEAERQRQEAEAREAKKRAAAAAAAEVERKRKEAEAAVAAQAAEVERKRKEAEAAVAAQARALELQKERLKQEAEAAAAAVRLEKRRRAAEAKAAELAAAEAALKADPQHWLEEARVALTAGDVALAGAHCAEGLRRYEAGLATASSSGVPAVLANLRACAAAVLAESPGTRLSDVLSEAQSALVADENCISGALVLARARWRCGDAAGAQAAVRAALPVAARLPPTSDSLALGVLDKALRQQAAAVEAARAKLAAASAAATAAVATATTAAAVKDLLKACEAVLPPSQQPKKKAGSAAPPSTSSAPAAATQAKAQGWSWVAAALLGRAVAAAGDLEEVYRVARAALPPCVGGCADIGTPEDSPMLPPPLLELAELHARTMWQLEDVAGAAAHFDMLIAAVSSGGAAPPAADASAAPASPSATLLEQCRSHIASVVSLQSAAAAKDVAGDHAAAIEMYDTALAVARVPQGHVLANPRLVASLLFGKAKAVLSAGRPEQEAFAVVNAAAEAFPGHVAARLLRARLCVRMSADDAIAAASAIADYEAVVAALRRGQQGTGEGGRTDVQQSVVVSELRTLQSMVAVATLRRAEAEAAAAAAAEAAQRETAARELKEEYDRTAPERERQAAERRRAAAEAAQAAAERRAKEAAAREARRRANEEARAATEEARRRARAEWEAKRAAGA